MTTAPVLFVEFENVFADVCASRQAALRAALASDAVTLSDDDFERNCGGLSFADAARTMYTAAGVVVDETTVDLCARRADREFRAMLVGGVRLAQGAHEFVRGAAGHVRLCLVACAAPRDVDVVLSLAGLGDAFECVITAEDDSGAARDLDIFERARVRVGRRGGTIDEGIALVASHGAITAARTAGMQTIVVGPVSPLAAFAGDARLASLEGVRVVDVVCLAAGRTQG